jgi:hypothetical protein
MKKGRSLDATARNLPEAADDLGVCSSEIEQRDGRVHVGNRPGGAYVNREDLIAME